MADQQHAMIAAGEDDGHELFEFADEEQIIAELAGRVTDKYVYELKGVKDERGNQVVGLSYAGTNWACREYAKQGELIRVNPKPEVVLDPSDDEYVIVVVTAQRWSVDRETGKEIPLDTALGVKRQWKKQLRNIWENGRVVRQEAIDDKFFMEKAFSKAQRNAKQALIPTDFVTQIIQKALAQKNGKTVQRPQGSPPQQNRPAPRGQSPAPRPQTASKPQQPKPPQNPPASNPAQPSGPSPSSQSSPSSPAPSAPAGASASGDSGGGDLSAMRAKFWAFLKQAAGAKDDEAARNVLKGLVGMQLQQIPIDTLKSLGRLLWSCVRNEHKFDGSTNRILDQQNRQVWPPPDENAPPEADPFSGDANQSVPEEPPPPDDVNQGDPGYGF